MLPWEMDDAVSLSRFATLGIAASLWPETVLFKFEHMKNILVIAVAMYLAVLSPRT